MWPLLLAAACLHVALTGFVFFGGRHKLFPNVFEVNGVAIASDGFVYHAGAIALVELLEAEGAAAWLAAPAPFHLKLYSLSYALFHPLSGFNVLSAEPLNLFYYLAVVWLVFGLGREAFGRRVGSLAALAVALWPSFLLHTTQLLKDPIFVAAMLALVWTLVGWLKRSQSPAAGAACGLAGGVAAALLWLVRSEMWEVAVAIMLLGTGLLLLRHLLERRVLAGNLLGAGLLLLVALSVPRLMTEFEPFGSYRATDTSGRVAAGGPEADAGAQPAAAEAGRRTWWQKIWGRAERAAARTGRIRHKFTVEYPSAGSNIDTDVQFGDVGGFVRHVPRAAAVGFFAPFPDMWFVKRTRVGLAGRLFSGVETIALYACEACAAFGLWRRRRELAAWLLASAAAVGVTALGMVVINVGTLYRMRYVFWMLVIVLGVDGALQLRRAASGKGAAQEPPPHAPGEGLPRAAGGL